MVVPMAGTARGRALLVAVLATALATAPAGRGGAATRPAGVLAAAPVPAPLPADLHFGAVPIPTPPPAEVSFGDLPPAPPPGPQLTEPGEVNPEVAQTHPGARRSRVFKIAATTVPAPALAAPAAAAIASAGVRRAASLVQSTGPDPMLLQTSFAGNSGGGAMDMNVAEGDGQVVEASNAGLTVYERNGLVLSGPKSLAGLFQSGLSSGDPRILFDSQAHRFMIAGYVCQPTMGTCGFPEGIRLAVSQTADATGLWWVYDVADETMNGSNRLDDQPRIGVTDDKIVLTWDQIDPGNGPKDYNYDGHEIVRAFARGAALVGVPVQVQLDVGDKHALVPTIRGPGVSGNDAYAVYYDWGLIDDHIGVITVTGNPNLPQTVGWAETDLKIAAMHDPPAPGGVPKLSQPDTRFLWATETQNSLWVGANDKCHPSGDTQDRMCGRVIQVDFGVQTDVDLARLGGDVLYPAPVGDCTDGHVAVAISLSDGTNPPNAVITGSPLPVTKTSFQAWFLASGSNAFTDSRWGDYQGIAQESDDCDSLWSVTQYGGTTDGTTTGTRISQVTFAGPTVDKVVPNEGEPGTTVDVFGRHFAPGAFVAFGATPATSVQFISGTDLRVVSPPHVAGSVDVTVTTLNGTSATSPADVYTYPAVAYVTDRGSNDLFRIDTATLAGSPIPLVSSSPQGIALAPGNDTAWVSANGDDSLVPVDLPASSQEPAIPLGAGAAPEGVAVSPDGSTAYVADTGLDMVTAVDTATDTPRWSVPTPAAPAHLALTPDGSQLFVTDSGANAVTPIAVAGAVPVVGPPIPVSAPMGISMTPDGSTAYVTDLDWTPATAVSHVTPINVATHTAGTPIPIVATDPEAITVLTTGTTAYVSSTADGTLVPIALPSNVAGSPFAVGPFPRGSASLQDGSELFVAVAGLSKVAVVDTSTNIVINAASVGIDPYEIAITHRPTPACPVNGYFTPTLTLSPSSGPVGGLENRVVDVNQCGDLGDQPGIVRTKVTVPMGCPKVLVKPMKVTFHNGDNPLITQFVAPTCPGAYIFAVTVFRKVGLSFVKVAPATFATLTLS